MNVLILVRGLPGSGKSTFAKKLMEIMSHEDFVHYEADMYHIDETGKYVWKPENVKASHAWCRMQALTSLNEGRNVVVSNTFTQEWEMEPYIDMWSPVFVLRAEGNYQNIHGVPPETLEKMSARFESVPYELPASEAILRHCGMLKRIA